MRELSDKVPVQLRTLSFCLTRRNYSDSKNLSGTGTLFKHVTLFLSTVLNDFYECAIIELIFKFSGESDEFVMETNVSDPDSLNPEPHRLSSESRSRSKFLITKNFWLKKSIFISVNDIFLIRRPPQRSSS
jgi:hypothetical protein